MWCVWVPVDHQDAAGFMFCSTICSNWWWIGGFNFQSSPAAEGDGTIILRARVLSHTSSSGWLLINVILVNVWSRQRSKWLQTKTGFNSELQLRAEIIRASSNWNFVTFCSSRPHQQWCFSYFCKLSLHHRPCWDLELISCTSALPLCGFIFQLLFHMRRPSSNWSHPTTFLWPSPH